MKILINRPGCHRLIEPRPQPKKNNGQRKQDPPEMKLLIKRPELPKDAYFVKVAGGGYTIIDKSAWVLVTRHKWKLHKSSSRYYVVRAVVHNRKETLIFLHRWLTHCPDGMQVHHMNGNALDNRRCNLLIVTPDQNRRMRIFRQTHTLTRKP